MELRNLHAYSVPEDRNALIRVLFVGVKYKPDRKPKLRNYNNLYIRRNNMQYDSPAKIQNINPVDSKYIDWLKERSMLYQGEKLTQSFAGNRNQWQHAFGDSEFSKILNSNSIWLSVYADSIIGLPEQSTLDVLGSKTLLTQLSSLGIKAIHTGPLKRSGSVQNRQYGPSIDGHFDRIESKIDPAYGDQSQYEKLVQNAAENEIVIIGDLVPGHTGKGPDFRLAEYHEPGFANIYTMLDIKVEDWVTLPPVPTGRDSVNLTQKEVRLLNQRGYSIVAPMNAEIFARPNIKESCWSVTNVVKGVDGVDRRWVYLHVFKQGQPSLNWTDPSFAAYRMQTADALHSLHTLGTKGLRMDATMFLGLEARPGQPQACLAGHPITTRVTDILAMVVRKFGGFSFQELNVELDKLHQSLSSGPEFNYDFISRPALFYALVSSDAGPLRLMLREMLKYKVQPRRMVHGMQNHDELMLEATHLSIHGDEVFEYEGTSIRGDDLAAQISQLVLANTTGENREYNHAFAMSPGVCSTLTGLIGAAIGVESFANISLKHLEKIRQIHLLAAAFNALQGGIFNISGWDLLGCVPLAIDSVSDLLADNDHRWINRGGYDLIGSSGNQKNSLQGLPKAISLYGSIPSQLEKPDSFVSLLQSMLSRREKLGIASSELIDIPEVQNESLVVLINQLPKSNKLSRKLQITALNFSDKNISQMVSCSCSDGVAVTTWSSINGLMELEESFLESVLCIQLLPYEAKLIEIDGE